MTRCPFCKIFVSTKHGLIKHLAGGTKYGGHAKQEMEAQEIALQLFAGSFRMKIASAAYANADLKKPHVNPTDPYGSFLADFFRTLVANKKLPKYQFERRVDAIVAMFLPAILKQLKDWIIEPVVPEFPLKKASNNQSTNADSLWFRKANGPIEQGWIFFELKTDSASCNDPQLQTYLTAMDKGMPALFSDLEAISSATSARDKYAALRSRLAPFPADAPIELVYLSPRKIACRDPRVVPVSFSDLANMELEPYSLVWNLFGEIVIPHLNE